MRSAARKHSVSQTAVTKALRAARDTGYSVSRIEVEPTGRFTLFMGEPEPASESNFDVELDRILERRE